MWSESTTTSIAAVVKYAETALICALLLFRCKQHSDSRVHDYSHHSA